MRAWTALKQPAARLVQQTMTVYFVARDPRTPLHVRALAVLVAAYALSPIDLIPDVIPVIGYLDDVILIPLGLALVVRMTPPDLIAAASERALQAAKKPTSRIAAACIIAVWLAVLWFAGRWLFAMLRR